jgi:hypothetical protein
LLATLLIGSFAVGASGCVKLSSCKDVCYRYSDCFDSDYDVDDCIDSCISNAREDEQYAEQIDVCHVCQQDRSCSESFGCAGECAGIVP